MQFIKEAHQSTSEDFIAKLSLTNHQLMKEIEELREKVSDIDFTVNVKTAKIATHENYHQEMFKRMETVENTADELVKTTINLEFVKCEKALYEEEMGAVK